MWPVLEADLFMFNEAGEYEFHPSKLGFAHEQCRLAVATCMSKFGFAKIFVSNTFTTEKEMQPYLDLAEKYGYTVVSMIIENRHGNKSVHDVPEETMTKMKNRFSIKL